MAPRRKKPSAPALEPDATETLTTPQLTDLIADVRSILGAGPEEPSSYEVALARLEAEAARRGVELATVPEPRMVAPRIDQMLRRAQADYTTSVAV